MLEIIQLCRNPVSAFGCNLKLRVLVFLSFFIRKCNSVKIAKSSLKDKKNSLKCKISTSHRCFLEIIAYLNIFIMVHVFVLITHIFPCYVFFFKYVVLSCLPNCLISKMLGFGYILSIFLYSIVCIRSHT